MTENGYMLVSGTLADLANLGLTPESAVGMRFTFNGGDDLNEYGELSDIMSGGVIIKDDKWRYLCMRDEKFFWRVKPAELKSMLNSPIGGNGRN